MQKFLFSLFLICLISIININSALADFGWENPKSIRVYIEQNSRKPMMKNAFAKWTTLTNGRLVFKYVESPNNAQIKVKFVKDATKNYETSDNAIGVTHVTPMIVNNKVYIDSATIEIADHVPGSGGKLMPNDRIFRVMVHEIGHAIGFQGRHAHSADKQSLMYPVAHSRNQIITPNDLNFLSVLYGW